MYKVSIIINPNMDKLLIEKIKQDTIMKKTKKNVLKKPHHTVAYAVSVFT